MKRGQRVMWTKEEEDALRQGVMKFGKGEWKRIQAQYIALAKRSNVDLKDKWENLQKADQRRQSQAVPSRQTGLADDDEGSLASIGHGRAVNHKRKGPDSHHASAGRLQSQAKIGSFFASSASSSSASRLASTAVEVTMEPVAPQARARSVSGVTEPQVAAESGLGGRFKMNSKHHATDPFLFNAADRVERSEENLRLPIFPSRGRHGSSIRRLVACPEEDDSGDSEGEAQTSIVLGSAGGSRAPVHGCAGEVNFAGTDSGGLAVNLRLSTSTHASAPSRGAQSESAPRHEERAATRGPEEAIRPQSRRQALAQAVLNAGSDRRWTEAEGQQWPAHFEVPALSLQDRSILRSAQFLAPKLSQPFLSTSSMYSSDPVVGVKAHSRPEEGLGLHSVRCAAVSTADGSLFACPVETKPAHDAGPKRHWEATEEQKRRCEKEDQTFRLAFDRELARQLAEAAAIGAERQRHRNICCATYCHECGTWPRICPECRFPLDRSTYNDVPDDCPGCGYSFDSDDSDDCSECGCSLNSEDDGECPNCVGSGGYTSDECQDVCPECGRLLDPEVDIDYPACSSCLDSDGDAYDEWRGQYSGSGRPCFDSRAEGRSSPSPEYVESTVTTDINVQHAGTFLLDDFDGEKA